MTTSDDYLDRLARVQANRGRSVIMVGLDESFVHERKQPIQAARARELAGSAKHPASLIGAFVLGMVAAALGHYARFLLMSGPSAMPDATLEMLLSAFVGICVAFALSKLFRLTSKTHKAMQSAGVVLMVCGFHNLFFWAPQVMQTLFSPEYAAQITLNAVPNTLYVRGDYIPIGETPVTLPNAQTTALATTEIAAECTQAPSEVKRITLDGTRRKTVATPEAPEVAQGAQSCP